MKKAILVVSFGTSYRDTLEKTIGSVERDLKKAFGYEVRRAFTSGMIINKLLSRDGIKTDTVEEALQRLINEGFDEAVCVVTHIINGFEYDKVTKITDSFKDKIKISVTRPLVSLTEDYGDIIDALGSEFSKDKLYILMGHGTEHFSNAVYPALRYHLGIRGLDNVYVGTVEGFPTLDDIMDEMKETDKKQVVLMPFMLVAGDHANNDMVEWKEKLSDAGFEAECVMKGLGEYKNIRDIYIKRASEFI